MQWLVFTVGWEGLIYTDMLLVGRACRSLTTVTATWPQPAHLFSHCIVS